MVTCSTSYSGEPTYPQPTEQNFPKTSGSIFNVNTGSVWLMNQQFRKNSLNRCCAVKLSRWHRTKFVMAGLWRVFSKTTQAFSQLFDKPRVGSRSK